MRKRISFCFSSGGNVSAAASISASVLIEGRLHRHSNLTKIPAPAVLVQKHGGVAKNQRSRARVAKQLSSAGIMAPAEKFEVRATFDRSKSHVELIYTNCDARHNEEATPLKKRRLVGPDAKIERSTFLSVIRDFAARRHYFV